MVLGKHLSQECRLSYALHTVEEYDSGYALPRQLQLSLKLMQFPVPPNEIVHVQSRFAVGRSIPERGF